MPFLPKRQSKSGFSSIASSLWVSFPSRYPRPFPCPVSHAGSNFPLIISTGREKVKRIPQFLRIFQNDSCPRRILAIKYNKWQKCARQSSPRRSKRASRAAAVVTEPKSIKLQEAARKVEAGPMTYCDFSSAHFRTGMRRWCRCVRGCAMWPEPSGAIRSI